MLFNSIRYYSLTAVFAIDNLLLGIEKERYSEKIYG
jgi:hypothetical protein